MLSTSSFVALILVALLWPHGWTDIFVTGGIAPLLIAVTIFFTRISGWTTRIIGGPLLSKLGEASYVIYILQAPLWHYWQGLTNYLRQLPMQANTVEAWQFVGFLPFLVLTSLAVQHFIETPLRAWIRSWKKRDLAAQIQNKEELSRIANVKASKRISVDINFGRNNMHVTYSAAFFENQMNASYISAKTVMPHVISLCQPRSIADFGCGVGSWLRSCRECGITDITGVDGQYVEEQLLMIPQDNFVKADLTRPIDLHRRFDLVLSLEVAEHLPSDTASTFVDTLTRHAPIILFSAAVPSQGGVHHVNEQWGQYWQSAFAARDYACLDCLRDVFWDNRSIDWWYRQNMFLFVAESTLSEFPKLVEETARPRRLPLDLVHPGRPFENQIGIRTLMRQLPGAIKFSLNRVMHMISGNSTPTN